MRRKKKKKVNAFQFICLTSNFLKFFYSVCFTENPPIENTSISNVLKELLWGKKNQQKLLKEIHLNLVLVIDSLNI